MTPIKTITTLVHVLLLIVIALIIITGYGITDYHTVESITFGALSKPLSYQLHTALIIPLILLVSLHILFIIWKKYHGASSMR